MSDAGALCFCRPSFKVPVEEVQSSMFPPAQQLSALGPIHVSELDVKSGSAAASPPLRECRGYSVFRGINTSGSYHVYGDRRAAPGKSVPSQATGTPTGAFSSSRKAFAHVAGTAAAPREESPAVAAFRPAVIGPAAQAEEDGVCHPLADCRRSSLTFGKGVICSPQSPLRSDCQPNSPTESSSSRNAGPSLKRPPDGRKEAEVRNWKKYKFIVMNQNPESKETEAPTSGPESGSPSRSPCGSGADQRESQTEEAAGEENASAVEG